jgi:hypothetical protein
VNTLHKRGGYDDDDDDDDDDSKTPENIVTI